MLALSKLPHSRESQEAKLNTRGVSYRGQRLGGKVTNKCSLGDTRCQNLGNGSIWPPTRDLIDLHGKAISMWTAVSGYTLVAMMSARRLACVQYGTEVWPSMPERLPTCLSAWGLLAEVGERAPTAATWRMTSTVGRGVGEDL